MLGERHSELSERGIIIFAMASDYVWTRYLPSRIRARVEGRSTLQKVIGNTGWLFTDKIVRLGVGLFVSAWIARYLGPEKFGIFNYAIAFVAIFDAVACLGLDGIVVRDLVREPEAREEILGTSFVLKFIGSFLIIPIALSAILAFRVDDPLAVWLVGILAIGNTFKSLDVIDYWFQSQVRSRFVVIARLSAFLLCSAARVFLIVTKGYVIGFAWVVALEIAIGSLSLLAFYRACGQQVRKWRLSFNRAALLLKNSWPLMLSSLSVILYMKIDQIMLGDMLSNDSVGVYTAATKLSELWYFIPMALVSSVFPSIVETRSKDPELYRARLQNLLYLLTGMSFALSIITTFVSGGVISIVFGDQYASSAPVLAVHIWASIFVFMGMVQGAWDLSENLVKLSFYRTLAGAVINIGLNFLLIPRYAALGAAVATLISYSFSAWLLNSVYDRTRQLFVMQSKSLLFFIKPLQR